MCRGIKDINATDLGDIDDLVWNKCLDVAPHVRWITAFGSGEPLADPKILERLQQLDQTGVQYGFSTNGTLLDKETGSSLYHVGKLNSSFPVLR